MPVLITGATGMVGRALGRRLLAEDGQVRAYIRRDDQALRDAGVHVAIGEACNVERLESALTRVHTIVHLVGGLFPAKGESLDALNRESTECAVIAARSAEVRRFVFLSFLGADPGSPNAFLAAKGAAERHIIDSGLEYAIIRSAPILEGLPAVVEGFRTGPLHALPGSGEQPVASVALGEALDAIVQADARDAAVHAVTELTGEPVPFGELLMHAGVEGRTVWARRLARGPAAEVFARGVGASA